MSLRDRETCPLYYSPTRNDQYLKTSWKLLLSSLLQNNDKNIVLVFGFTVINECSSSRKIEKEKMIVR